MAVFDKYPGRASVRKWSWLVLATLLMTGCATQPTPPQTPATRQGADENAVTSGATSETESLEAEGEESASVEDTHLYPGTGVIVQPARFTASAKPVGSDSVTLNFVDADLWEVVKVILGDLMQENYIIDPAVKGVVNLYTSGPILRRDLLPTLETLLRMNAAAVVWEAGLYKVLPITAVPGSLSPQLGYSAGAIATRGFSVRIVPLKYIAAQEMAKVLKPVAANGESIQVDATRNMLILTGTSRELTHLQDTIDMFDVDWLTGMSFGLISLQNVDVKTMKLELDLLFQKNTSPIRGVVKFLPIERLNALFVITPEASYLEQARLWIERLDRSSGASGGTRLFVYAVQNGIAENIADLLNDIFSDGGDTDRGAAVAPGKRAVKLSDAEENAESDSAVVMELTGDGGAGDLDVSGDIRVIADEDNNALVILASPADYNKVELAIRKLDVVPRQVLIDVLIAEITLTGDLTYGLEWAFRDGAERNGLLDLGSAGIGAVVPGFSYVWNDADDVEAAFNLLATDSRINIISSPHIMVTDNQTASINVGDQVPTTSRTQTGQNSNNLISTVQYIDTGVLLDVTPRINAGGLVTMEIQQEVSAATRTTSSDINSPTISTRELNTTVIVESGQTMIMGGLITENKNRTSSGLPYLSKIPVIGALFGNQSYQNDRTELIVLITPHMVANSQQAREVTSEFREKMGGLKETMAEF